MKYLAYSPHIEAYAAVYNDGNNAYYDLTDDITSCVVTRNLSSVSTFTLRLANPQHKYNGLFTPMDRITIFGAKDSSAVRLITGYMTSLSSFTLYEKDFAIKGVDTLGLLQRLYWDPDLTASYQLLLNSINSGAIDTNGGWTRIRDLLEQVGGWPASMVEIQKSIPQGVIDWVVKLYQSQASDYTDAEKIANDFYNVIASSTASLTSSSSSSSGTASSAQVEQAVEWAIAIANDDSNGYDQADRWGEHSFDCSSLVIRSCEAAGMDVSGATCTSDMKSCFTASGWTWHEMGDALARGDILLRIGVHTAWYIGDGQICQAAHNENGGITGGQVGDQTGKEISVGAYWDDDWSGFLRFGS